MNGSVLIISFIICGIGLTISFVYLNPFGFVIDGLGFMLFIYGLKSNSDKQEEMPKGRYISKDEYYRARYEEEYKCANCLLFGKSMCQRNEIHLNAQPCDNYEHDYRKIK